jgi:hypothetical protein
MSRRTGVNYDDNVNLNLTTLEAGKRGKRGKEGGEEKGGGKSLLNQPAKLNRRSHRPLLS